MLKVDIISVQPGMFSGFLTESIVARAVKKGLCEVNVVDLRDLGVGRWCMTDERPYGGGPGMLMRCEPWFAAVEACPAGQHHLYLCVVIFKVAQHTPPEEDVVIRLHVCHHLLLLALGSQAVGCLYVGGVDIG